MASRHDCNFVRLCRLPLSQVSEGWCLFIIYILANFHIMMFDVYAKAKINKAPIINGEDS